MDEKLQKGVSTKREIAKNSRQEKFFAPRSPYQVDMGRREVTAEDGTSIVHIVTLTHVLA